MLTQNKDTLGYFVQFSGLRTRPWINLNLVWRIERLPENDPAHPGHGTGYVLFFLAADEAPVKITDQVDVLKLAMFLGDDREHYF